MTRSLLVTLALALPAAAAEPKAVIEKAVKAHGGAELLDKFGGLRSTLKGTISAGGMDIPVTGVQLRAYPDKEKVTATLSVAGMELELLQVTNGDKVGLTVGGQARATSDADKTEARFSTYANSLSRLTPLLKAGGPYTLKAGPEAAVNGDPAVGVVVEHAAFKPVTLYFDTASGRLVKVTRTGKAEDGTDAERETVYSDYKAVQGVQMPHRSTSTVGGKKVTDFTAEKVELLEKVEDGEFAVE